MKTEGIWSCDVLSAAFGEDDRGAPQVQINVRITDGPDKGQLAAYEDQVNTKSAPYVARTCKAVGWVGIDIRTLAEDVASWIEKTGGQSTVEIKHLQIRSGKRAGEIWDKVSSIGKGPRVLKQVSSEMADDVNRALAEADDGERIPF